MDTSPERFCTLDELSMDGETDLLCALALTNPASIGNLLAVLNQSLEPFAFLGSKNRRLGKIFNE